MIPLWKVMFTVLVTGCGQVEGPEGNARAASGELESSAATTTASPDRSFWYDVVSPSSVDEALTAISGATVVSVARVSISDVELVHEWESGPAVKRNRYLRADLDTVTHIAGPALAPSSAWLLMPWDTQVRSNGEWGGVHPAQRENISGPALTVLTFTGPYLVTLSSRADGVFIHRVLPHDGETVSLLSGTEVVDQLPYAEAVAAAVLEAR